MRGALGGWLAGLGHFIFLGVGMDQPGALGLIALLILILARPLAPAATSSDPASAKLAVHTLAAMGAAALILGAGLSLAGRHAEPAVAAEIQAP